MAQQTTIIDQFSQEQKAQNGAGQAAGIAAAYYLELTRKGVPPDQAAVITSAWVKAALETYQKKAV